jgi:subtilisin family serine protease
MKYKSTIIFILTIILVLLPTPYLLGVSYQSAPTITHNFQANGRTYADVRTALRNSPAARVIINLYRPSEAEVSSLGQAAAIALIQDKVLSRLPPHSFKLVHRFNHIPALAGTITITGLIALESDPLVDSVQLDVPVIGHDSASLSALRADVVQNAYGITGEGITVAVLDTGIDVDHPDFHGRIIAQQCFTYGDCQPGNVNQSPNADDLHGHGTNVAGIIASNGTVSADTRGFAPDVNIVAVRVLDRNNSGWLSDWVAGLDWIYANLSSLGVDVINMSLGTWNLYSGNCDSVFPSVADIVDQLVSSGVVIFASTGNQGSSTTIASPACSSGVIAVGATYDGNLGRQPASGTWNSIFGGNWPACYDDPTGLDTITCFTNSNDQMDLVAPGVWIASSGIGGGISYFAGTSQASPTVAGIAALMLQVRPDLTPAQIKNLLKQTGQVVTDPKNGLQFPRVDALAAVLANTTVTIIGPSVGVTNTAYAFSAHIIPFAITEPITYTWQATDQTPTTTLNSEVTFIWSVTGTKVITASVVNAGGIFTDAHIITILETVHTVYLPLIYKEAL